MNVERRGEKKKCYGKGKRAQNIIEGQTKRGRWNAEKSGALSEVESGGGGRQTKRR